MMGKRELPQNSGDECDVFGPWRRVVCSFQRAGACRRVKRGYARRVRAHARRELRAVVA